MPVCIFAVTLHIFLTVGKFLCLTWLIRVPAVLSQHINAAWDQKKQIEKAGASKNRWVWWHVHRSPWGLQQPADGGSVPRLDSWGSTIVQGPFIGRVSVCFVLRSVRLLSPPSRDPPALFCRDLQNGAVGKPSPSTPLTAELCVRCECKVCLHNTKTFLSSSSSFKLSKLPDSLLQNLFVCFCKCTTMCVCVWRQNCWHISFFPSRG